MEDKNKDLNHVNQQRAVAENACDQLVFTMLKADVNIDSIVKEYGEDKKIMELIETVKKLHVAHLLFEYTLMEFDNVPIFSIRRKEEENGKIN